jgi:hypothetical protein
MLYFQTYELTLNLYFKHELLKHPETYKKVQEEVDSVVGKGPVTVQHIQQLPYIEGVRFKHCAP